jgi:hypothetical protein
MLWSNKVSSSLTTSYRLSLNHLLGVAQLVAAAVQYVPAAATHIVNQPIASGDVSAGPNPWAASQRSENDIGKR